MDLDRPSFAKPQAKLEYGKSVKLSCSLPADTKLEDITGE